MPEFDPFGPFRRAGASAGGKKPAPGARPATARTLPWHRRPTWTRAGRQLLRWYSKRSDFSLRIEPGPTGPLARVDPERRRVKIRAVFPEPGEHVDFDLNRHAGRRSAPAVESIRGHDLLAARPTELWLRGLIGHEAGHILFSGEKPQPPVLGWVWNALEDERIERLMTRQYDRLGLVFACMGDVMLSETDPEREQRRKRQIAAARREARGEPPSAHDVLSACLKWRWLAGHAADAGSAGYHPYMPLPEAAFTGRLRPLVEAAWDAGSSGEVADIARQILTAFDLSEEAEVPRDLAPLDLPGGMSPTGPSSGPGSSSGPGNPAPGASGRDDDRGEGGSGAGGPEPEMPPIDPESDAGKEAADLVHGQEAEARALAEALRPRARGPLRRAHRSRGHFDYRRYTRGAGRVFTRRPEQPEPPAFLTVLLDVSGSMARWHLLPRAKRCTALLSAASELAGTDLRVIPFREEAAPPLTSRAVGHEALRQSLAALRPGGSTRLAPALQAGLQGAPAGSGRHVVVLISDGRLSRGDAERCERALRRARRGQPAPLVLPLLLGAAAEGGAGERAADGSPSGRGIYEQVFGRYAALQGEAPELSDVARRWLRHTA